jgi:putative ABC transport system permease protein
MTLIDSFTLAFRTVRSNRLRTGITVAIIAFGIMALIGIITAIQSMNQSLRESFSSMGANAFSLRFKESKARIGGHDRPEVELSKRGQKEKKSNLGKVITKEQALDFKQTFAFPSMVSIYFRMGSNVECRYNDKKTNPQETVWGGDENYVNVTGYTIQTGRNFSAMDIQSGRNVCLIGYNTATKLFGDDAPERCIDKLIQVGGKEFLVIGLLKSKGSSSFLRQDEVIITPYNNSARFNNPGNSYTIGVMVGSVQALEGAIGETTSLFRSVRKLEPLDEDNFVVEKSDKFAELFIAFLSSITASAGAIGLITLIGAAIGLMNIMLVSVNERTKEVGLIKAIGGKRKDVRLQFLFESMIISLLGALFGIFLGVLVGNLFGLILNTGFVIPWAWVVAGIIICSLVGLAAGIYPAMKAAKLNPIVALRYE